MSAERWMERNVEAVSEQEIESLVNNEQIESRWLEYKATLDFDTGDQRKEFFADITSFANSSGGWMFIGVVCRSGIPTHVPGLDLPREKHDELKLRLENAIRDSIEPRLVGMQMGFVPLKSGSFVLAIKIPRSLLGPHMVKSSSKFFGRNSSGKNQWDVSEIRSGFLASEDVGGRIRRFRIERIGAIMANEAPFHLLASPALVVHVIPRWALVTKALVDLRQFERMSPMGTSAGGWQIPRTNLLGIGCCTTYADCLSYSQVFHDGCVEGFDAGLMSSRANAKDENLRNMLPCNPTEIRVANFVRDMQAKMRSAGSVMPFLVGVTLIGVRGWRLAFERDCWSEDSQPVRDNVMMLPEVEINESSLAELDQALRPFSDAFRSAFGFPSAFGEDGKRLRPR